MIQTVALLSVFGLGIAFSAVGALKLELTRQLKINDAQFGKLISALMFTSIFVVLAFGPLVDMFGYRPIAIAGFLLGALAVYMLVSSRSYGGAALSCIVLGVGAMCLNLGNTLIPMVLFEGNPAAASNFGNIFFGIGAFITPILVGMLLSRLGYKATGTLITLLLLVPVTVAAFAAYPEVQRTGLTFGRAFADAFGLLANPAIVIAGLALFCYVGLEVSMGGWISTYAANQGYDSRGANMVLSSFWVGLMIARLIASVAVTSTNGIWAISILALAIAVLTGLMIATNSKSFAALLVFLTGICFGPIFPTVVGVTFSKIDQSSYGSAFGIIFAIGLLGGSTLPAAIGMYSRGKPIKKSFPIAIAAALVLFVLAFLMGRV
ncbi:MAG: putative transporter [Acidobacteria bacterium]|nr:putative transporter [Acidobacteriota bacterium]